MSKTQTDADFERQQEMLRGAVPAALRALGEIAAGPPSRAQRAAQRALQRYLKRLEPPRGPKQ